MREPELGHDVDFREAGAAQRLDQPAGIRNPPVSRSLADVATRDSIGYSATSGMAKEGAATTHTASHGSQAIECEDRVTQVRRQRSSKHEVEATALELVRIEVVDVHCPRIHA